MSSSRKSFNRMVMPVARTSSLNLERYKYQPSQQNPRRVVSQTVETSGLSLLSSSSHHELLPRDLNIDNTELLAQLVRAEKQERALQPHRNLVFRNEVSQLRCFRHGDTLEILAPVAIIRDFPTRDGKTEGFLQLKNNPEVLMAATSGWSSAKHPNALVLDCRVWTAKVHDFCSHMGHPVPLHYYDQKEAGYFFASHVEMKLILFLLLKLVANPDGSISSDKLKELRSRQMPIEAVVTIDKAPCDSCESFRLMIAELTGVLVNFEIAPLLAQYKIAKAGRNHYKLLLEGALQEPPKNISRACPGYASRSEKGRRREQLKSKQAAIQKESRVSQMAFKKQTTTTVTTTTTKIRIEIPLRSKGAILKEQTMTPTSTQSLVKETIQKFGTTTRYTSVTPVGRRMTRRSSVCKPSASVFMDCFEHLERVRKSSLRRRRDRG